jgi:hypothetical protein
VFDVCNYNLWHLSLLVVTCECFILLPVK